MYIIEEDLNIKYFGKALHDLRSMRSDCVYVCFSLIQQSSGMKRMIVFNVCCDEVVMTNRETVHENVWISGFLMIKGVLHFTWFEILSLYIAYKIVKID
jgi:hypothetical protein